MPSIEQQVELVKTLVTGIRSNAAALSPEQLASPSACADWQVQDVLSHLIGGAERQADSMRRGRAGDSGPAPGFTPMDSTAMSSTNAQRDIQRREQLGDGLLLAYDTAYASLQEQIDALGPNDWETPCWHLRRGAISAADYLELRIQELAIHDWDMRHGLEDSPQLNADCVSTLLSATPKWLGMCFRPGEKLDAPVVYEFDLAPPYETSIIVRVAGRQLRLPGGRRSPRPLDGLRRGPGLPAVHLRAHHRPGGHRRQRVRHHGRPGPAGPLRGLVPGSIESVELGMRNGK